MSYVREYGISEMAYKFGVSLRTLRYYEAEGLLCPKRIGTDRSYGVADQVRMELIQKGRHLGFTLSEIAKLIHSATSYNNTSLVIGRERISAQIVRLVEKRTEVDLNISELRRALQERND